MKKLLVLNGPNLNILGKRDKNHYGQKTLLEINRELLKIAAVKGVSLKFFQSNHEGDLIDEIQKADGFSGILINPGALTHYGYSLRDALSDSGLPIIEVHLSDISKREPFRKINVLDDVVILRIAGHKEKSYEEGLLALISHVFEK